MNSVRPRVLAALGLTFAALGALAAVLVAVLGPHSLSGGYVAVTAVTLVFRVSVVLGGVGAAVAVFRDRPWAVSVMVSSAAFFLGYAGGYFFSQGLGLWYPTP